MKNILIIGASSGIGKQVATQLEQGENQLFLTYQNNKIESNNTYYLDVEKIPDSLDFIPDVLDGLVYCPGTINLQPFASFTAEDFLRDFKIQVVGAIEVIKKVLPNLKKSKLSSIVLFSTVAVQKGFRYHTQVSASKGAIEGLVRALAADLAPKVRVNAVAPSITQTPLASKLLSSEQKIENSAKRHPLRRIGQVEDIANAVEFLLSDKSSWMTGQILHIDGGISSIINN